MNTPCRLALDLGTTTLSGRLIDAEGATLAEARMRNPQIAVARDVISRLEAAEAGRAEELRTLLDTGIDNLIATLTASVGHVSIEKAAVAGNSAISHLLQGASARSLIFPPHRPTCRTGWFAPGELAPSIQVPAYLVPPIGGYVGGDMTAFLAGEPDDGRVRLLVDLGTNGEIALSLPEKGLATSVAAGPAFEGDGVAAGMIEGAGAVHQVDREGDRLIPRTIGGAPPAGLCGSGVIELVAAARTAGLIDTAGTLADPLDVESNLVRYLDAESTPRRLVLYRDARRVIPLDQEEIRQFQLAKGAVRAGVHALLVRAGIEESTVAELVLTGSFGTSLRPESLKRVALFSESMVDKVRFVPAGVLRGLTVLLTDADPEEGCRRVTEQYRHLPMSGTPVFETAFLESLDFS